MTESQNSLEEFWDNLLSRQPEKIISAYTKLNSNERTAVKRHLRRMTSEPGWHPQQQRSAKIAISALNDHYRDNNS
jgi:hypothetical protein